MSTAAWGERKGIGGWLIFVVIGLVISPFRIAYFLAAAYWPIFRDDTWHQLTTPGTHAYHALWAPLLCFELIGNLGMMALALVTLVSLLRRKRGTPRLAIAWLAFAAAYVAVDYFVANLIPAVAALPSQESAKELLRSLVVAAIWIPYFLVSKRVEATFVE